MQMADKGRGGGRRGCGRSRDFTLTSPLTNPATSSIHTSESMAHVVVPASKALPTSQGQPNPTSVSESIPTTPVTNASLSTPHDSVTPKFPQDPNCELTTELRQFIRAHKGEFVPAHGCANAISAIIRAKFDKLAPNWLKISDGLRDRWFEEFKKNMPLEPFLKQQVRAF